MQSRHSYDTRDLLCAQNSFLRIYVFFKLVLDNGCSVIIIKVILLLQTLNFGIGRLWL